MKTGQDGKRGGDGQDAPPPPACRNCSTPLRACVVGPYRWACDHCSLLFMDMPKPGAQSDRDAIIADQIALIEAKHGAVLVDLAEWCLAALRNEKALRQELLFHLCYFRGADASISRRLEGK